jgi:hypothetical protein
VKKLVFRDENEAIEWRKEVILMSQFQHQNIVAFLGAATVRTCMLSPCTSN